MKNYKWVRPKEKKVDGVKVPFTKYCLFPKDTKMPNKPVRFMTINEFIRESEDE